MRKSLFAMAAASPLETSIAVAKRIEQGATGSAIGPTELADSELDMVGAGRAEVTGTNRGNKSTNSQDANYHSNNNKIQHGFDPT